MATRAEQLLISGSTDEITGALIGMLTVTDDDSDDIELAEPVYYMVRAMVAARVHMRDEYGSPMRWAELRGNLGFERYVALSEHLWLTDELREDLNAHLDAIGVDDEIRARLAHWRQLEEQGFPVPTWKAERGVLPKAFLRVASRHDDHVTGLRRPETFSTRVHTPLIIPGWSLAGEVGVLALLAAIAFQWWNWPMLIAWGETVRQLGLIAVGVVGVATIASAVSVPMRVVRNIFAAVVAAVALVFIAWSLRPTGFIVLAGLAVPVLCAFLHRMAFAQEQTLETEGTWRALLAQGFLSPVPAALAPWLAYQDSVNAIDATGLAGIVVMVLIQVVLVYALGRRIAWHRASVAEDVQIEMQDRRNEEDAIAEQVTDEPVALADERWPSN